MRKAERLAEKIEKRRAECPFQPNIQRTEAPNIFTEFQTSPVAQGLNVSPPQIITTITLPKYNHHEGKENLASDRLYNRSKVNDAYSLVLMRIGLYQATAQSKLEIEKIRVQRELERMEECTFR